MKKILCFVLITVLLFIALAGCSDGKPEKHEKATDGVIAENETYRITRINGRCYVDFYGRTYGSGCILYLRPGDIYPSSEAMRTAILSGNIGDKHIGSIGSMRSDSQGYIRIPDPYDMYIPSFTEELYYGAAGFDSDGYYYMLFSSAEEAEAKQAKDKLAEFEVLYPEGYTFLYDEYNDRLNYSTATETDRGTEAKSGNDRYLLYEFERDGKKISVEERYSFRRSDGVKSSNGVASKTVPIETKVLVSDNGFYYCVTIYRHGDRPLTEEEILCWSYEKYTVNE